MAACKNSSGARSGEQNKAPFVAGPRPVPTEGLGEALADPHGCWGAHGGARPRAGFGSSAAPKMFCSRGMIRNCCGYSR